MIWQLLDGIALIAWLLCLVNTIVDLIVLPHLSDDGPADGPLVSIIIPARNEEAAIERTVRALLAQTYRAIEVIVVNDRSTDGTGKVLARIGDSRLRVIDGVEPPAGWLGKPWAVHQGSQAASGEYLLIVDADIVYEPPAVGAAVAELRRSGATMLTLLPHVEMRGFWENVAMPQLAIVALAFIPAWLSNRSRSVRLAVGGGTGNLIVRKDYEAIGGHEALKDAVVDDVALARLVRRSDRRSVAVRAEKLVSVRMYRGGSEIVNGFTKNIFAVLGRSYVVTIVLAILGVVFHVWPYASAILGSRVAMATVATITLTRLILFAALRYNLISAVFAHPLMILFWTWVSIRSMWKTGIKRELTWRGRTYDAAGTSFGADR